MFVERSNTKAYFDNKLILSIGEEASKLVKSKVSSSILSSAIAIGDINKIIIKAMLIIFFNFKIKSP